MGVTLKRHPFSGLVHSAGKLLRTSERFPASMATDLLSICTNTLYGVYERALRHLTETIDSSRIPSSAYQKWATYGF